MRKETWSIGRACTLGAFTGALVSLELAARFSYGEYLWFIGALIGGGIGYLAYDFRAVLYGIKRAWDDVCGWRPRSIRRKINLRLMALSGIVVGVASITFWVSVPVAALTYWLNPHMTVAMFIGIPLTFLTLAVTVVMGPMLLLQPLTIKELVECVRKSRYFAAEFNIIAIPLFVAREIPPTAVFITRFAKRAFFYVHADLRVLCFTDAAIGACVGYFAGSALIGAVVGGLFGVVDYELLSVRVFKLVPRRS